MDIDWLWQSLFVLFFFKNLSLFYNHMHIHKHAYSRVNTKSKMASLATKTPFTTYFG